MTRTLFAKPRFDTLAVTGGAMHYPDDEHILVWKVKNALFVHTTLSNRLLGPKGTLAFFNTITNTQIKLTAYGLGGITREVIETRQSKIQHKPILKSIANSRPAIDQVELRSISSSKTETYLKTNHNQARIGGSLAQNLKQLTPVLKQNNDLAVKIDMPEIDIFE